MRCSDRVSGGRRLRRPHWRRQPDRPGRVLGAGQPRSSSSPPTVVGHRRTGPDAEANAGTWTNRPTSSSVQWERCNASGAGCSAIAGATGVDVHAHSARRRLDDPRSGKRQQRRRQRPPGGLGADRARQRRRASLTGFTPVSGITGSPVTIEGSDFDGVSAVEFGRSRLRSSRSSPRRRSKRSSRTARSRGRSR